MTMSSEGYILSSRVPQFGYREVVGLSHRQLYEFSNSLLGL